jgi:ABC-type sugar transport system substrate-binding protein
VPTSENNTYWPQVYNVLHAVAEDLDIELDIYEFDVRDRFAKHIEGVKILNSKPKPDGAIFSVAFGNAEPLLNATEALNIPVFIQGPLFPSELPYIGSRPRNKFRTWVGYFYQDEFEKGYLLGKILLSKAHALGLHAGDGTIRVAGIGGDYTWFGSKLRQDGLVKAVDEDKQATLAQVVPTEWSEQEAYTKTLLLLMRHKDVPVVWAASDQLGIGASKALTESRYIIGKTAVTGGLDLSRNGLRHIADGKLSASVASTMLEYAKVLIYLYDYIHGIDFADDVSTEIRAPLHIATQENVDKFLRLFDRFEQIDYSVYSKHLNPDLQHYNLSIDNLSYKKKTAN